MGQSCSTKNKARGSADAGSPRPLRMPGQPCIVESFELDSLASPRVAFTVPNIRKIFARKLAGQENQYQNRNDGQ
jgi:hypothetical protein